jgi:hypothetical protein
VKSIIDRVVEVTSIYSTREVANRGMRSRDRFNRWSTFTPIFTNIAYIGASHTWHIITYNANCIVNLGLIFSVVCPLILLFSVFCFGILWILCHYNQPKLSKFAFQTGAFYPIAICQLFSWFILELCLTGLYILVRSTDNKATCIW